MVLIKKALNEFEVYVGAVCQGIMIILLLLQVISRYIFNRPFSWTEELALIFFIFSIYFGATAAVKRHQHLRLSIVLDKLSPKNRLRLEIVGNIIFLLFNCIIMTGLVTIIQNLYNNGTATAVTSIPKWINYSFLPFLFTVMVIRLIQDSVSKYKAIKSPDADNADSERQNYDM